MATISKSVTVSDGGVYNLELNVIPVGSTVTPVNDIQIWLHCADIWDKNYTTLDQVLADAPTLQALIASTNAVDYMVRSTDWASDSNVGLVPIMTSDTSPYGTVFYDSFNDTSGRGYQAFDGNDSTEWASLYADGRDGYVGYKFLNPTCVKKATIYSSNITSSGGFSYAILEASNDNNSWVELGRTVYNTTSTYAVNTQNNANYLYYRFRIGGYTSNSNRPRANTIQFYPKSGIPTNQNAMTYIGNNDYCANKLLSNTTWLNAICNSVYFESVLKIKVPTMTSDTAPSGECFGSSVYMTLFYQAFDGNTNSGCLTGDRSNAHIGYGFTSSVKVYLAKFVNYRYDTATSLPRVKNFKIQASNSKTSGYVDLASGQYPQNDLDYIQKSILNPTTTYKYYRLFIIDNWAGSGFNIGAKDIQFYGRA